MMCSDIDVRQLRRMSSGTQLSFAKEDFGISDWTRRAFPSLLRDVFGDQIACAGVDRRDFGAIAGDRVGALLVDHGSINCRSPVRSCYPISGSDAGPAIREYATGSGRCASVPARVDAVSPGCCDRLKKTACRAADTLAKGAFRSGGGKNPSPGSGTSPMTRSRSGIGRPRALKRMRPTRWMSGRKCLSVRI